MRGSRMCATAVIVAVMALVPAVGAGALASSRCAAYDKAEAQAACPVVTLKVAAVMKKKATKVLVSSNVPATVTVKGKVALGGGRKVKLNGGTKATTPGKPKKFRLKYTADLLNRLGELTPKQSLTLKITVSAPNAKGPPTKTKLREVLRGRKGTMAGTREATH